MAGRGELTVVALPNSTSTPMRFALAEVWDDTVRMGYVGVGSL